MKVVYVLVSSENDYYYEQFYISLLSLKKHNPQIDVFVLTDDITFENLTGFRGKALKYLTKVKKITFSEDLSQKIRSRYLKTNMPEYIKGDFLFIDCDTVVTGNITEIENKGVCLGMVLDKHAVISKHYMYMYMYMNAKKMNYSIGYNDKHFNSGVIWVRECEQTKKFFDLWHSLYIKTSAKDLCMDQLALNEANARMKGVIEELDGTWNFQTNCGIKYLADAKIIHYLGYQPCNKQNLYFNSLAFELASEEILVEIRLKEEITNKVKNIIEKPKQAFKMVTIIPVDCIAYPLIFSNHFRILKLIYVKFYKLFQFMEKIYGKIFFKIFKRA